MTRLLSFIIGYPLGCILTAEIVARVNGKDIKEIDKDAPGRGNPGMANVMLNMGFIHGIAVFVGDTLKTLFAMYVAYRLFFEEIGNLSYIYAGFGTLIGHNFPFWRKFNGGKGVLVTCVWYHIMMSLPSLAALGVGFLVAFFTGYLNLAAVVFPLAAIPLSFCYAGWETGILVIASAILMIIRNRKDLVLLAKGERKSYFGPSKGKVRSTIKHETES